MDTTKGGRRRRKGNIIYCRNGCGHSYDRRKAKTNKKISYNFYNHERVTCKLLPMLECKICSRDGVKKLIKGHLKMKQHLKTKGHLRRVAEATAEARDLDMMEIDESSSPSHELEHKHEFDHEHDCHEHDSHDHEHDSDIEHEIEIKDEMDFPVDEEEEVATDFDLEACSPPPSKKFSSKMMELQMGILQQTEDLMGKTTVTPSTTGFLGLSDLTSDLLGTSPGSDTDLPFPDTGEEAPVWPEKSPRPAAFTPQPLALFPGEVDMWDSLDMEGWERASAQDPFCYL